MQRLIGFKTVIQTCGLVLVLLFMVTFIPFHTQYISGSKAKTQGLQQQQTGMSSDTRSEERKPQTVVMDKSKASLNVNDKPFKPSQVHTKPVNGPSEQHKGEINATKQRQHDPKKQTGDVKSKANQGMELNKTVDHTAKTDPAQNKAPIYKPKPVSKSQNEKLTAKQKVLGTGPIQTVEVKTKEQQTKINSVSDLKQTVISVPPKTEPVRPETQVDDKQYKPSGSAENQQNTQTGAMETKESRQTIPISIENKIVSNKKFDMETPKAKATAIKAADVTESTAKKATITTTNNTSKQASLGNTNEAGRIGVFDVNEVAPVLIPDVKFLQSMDRNQLEQLYFLYIENLQTYCVRQRHVGNTVNGGYHICEDVLHKKPCVMYSFGCSIENDTSFDTEVSNRYNCEVFAFVKTPIALSKQTPGRRLTFYPFELDDHDDPAHNSLTLNSIKSILGHQQKQITILKLDIDTREWKSLQQIARGSGLQTVDLLIVEFHLCKDKCHGGNPATKEVFIQYLNVLRDLYNIGFRIYYFRAWSSCSLTGVQGSRTVCHDVHMMKK